MNTHVVHLRIEKKIKAKWETLSGDGNLSRYIRNGMDRSWKYRNLLSRLEGMKQLTPMLKLISEVISVAKFNGCSINDLKVVKK